MSDGLLYREVPLARLTEDARGGGAWSVCLTCRQGCAPSPGGQEPAARIGVSARGLLAAAGLIFALPLVCALLGMSLARDAVTGTAAAAVPASGAGTLAPGRQSIPLQPAVVPPETALAAPAGFLAGLALGLAGAYGSRRRAERWLRLSVERVSDASDTGVSPNGRRP